MMPKVQGIYGIYCSVSNKWYVGQSVDIDKRWAMHRHSFNSGKCSNTHLNRAWSKYGEGAFKFVVLEEVDNYALLTEREEFWLAEKRNLGEVYNQRVCVNSNAGIVRTPEFVLQMSIARKGIKRSPEAVAKGAEKRRGVKRSLETRAKIAASHTGTTATLEARANMAASHIGSKHTLEQKQKISASNIGKHFVALTQEQATEIRELYDTGVSQNKLAKMFNVSARTVFNVIHYQYHYSKRVG